MITVIVEGWIILIVGNVANNIEDTNFTSKQTNMIPMTKWISYIPSGRMVNSNKSWGLYLETFLLDYRLNSSFLFVFSWIVCHRVCCVNLWPLDLSCHICFIDLISTPRQQFERNSFARCLPVEVSFDALFDQPQRMMALVVEVAADFGRDPGRHVGVIISGEGPARHLHRVLTGRGPRGGAVRAEAPAWRQERWRTAATEQGEGRGL